MSEEGNTPKTEAENGIPETSNSVEAECNGTKETEEETVEPSNKGGSKFGSGLKMKALHAKEGISNKVGDLKQKFSKLKRRSESTESVSPLKLQFQFHSGIFYTFKLSK